MRLRLNVNLSANESIDLVVEMPKLSDVQSSNVAIAQRAKQSVDSIINKIQKEYAGNIIGQTSKSSTIQTAEEQWKAKQTAFATTTVYKLLRNNMAVLSKNPTSKIWNFIKMNGTDNLFLDIKLNAANNDIQKVAEFDQQFKDLSNYLSNESNLAASGMYDYLSIENSKYSTHVDGKEIVDILNVRATGINNKSFYAGLDKVAPIAMTVPANMTSTNNGSKFASNDDENTVLEEERLSSPDVQDITDAIDRVSSLLGRTFVDSPYFATVKGKIRLNGLTASGMVQDNAFMTLSQIDGQISASTASHEVFHIVYRNFVNPETQAKLLDAVRIISESEKGKAINGPLEAEEWMSRDFAKGTRQATTGNKFLDAAINLWNDFKNAMKFLTGTLSPIYQANKKLKDLYSRIEQGEFTDRVSEIKPFTSSTVFEEEGSMDRDEVSEDSTNERSENRLTIATKMEAALIKDLRNTASLVLAKNKLKMSILQNSLYSNTKLDNLMSLSESVSAIVSDSLEMQKTYGDKVVNVLSSDADGNIVPTPIKVSELLAKEKQQGYKENLANLSDNFVVDNYNIYTNDNVRMLIQIMLPSYDMMNDSFDHETGAGERFDWDGYSSEQNISAIQNLYLSSIPRIDANGNPIRGKAAFLDQKQVHSTMIDLGVRVSSMKDESMDKVEKMQRLILSQIENDRIVPVQHGSVTANQYLNESTEILHSIYNYMFEAKGQTGQPFTLNYNNTHFTGEMYADKFKGLLERTQENEIEWRRKVGVNQTTNDWTWNDEQQLEMDRINKARLHLNGLVSVYTSFNVKNQVKATYYDDTMKFTHFYKDFWRGTAEEIKRVQGYKISEGQLNKGSIQFFKDNVSITDKSIGVIQRKSDTAKTPFLKYEDGKFKFVSNNGTTQQSKRIGQNTLSAFNVASLEQQGEFKHIVDIFNRIKGQFALKSVSPNIFKSMLLADNWSQVTDSMETINTLGHTSNFNSEIRNNYTTPGDFMADYIGTMMTLYNQYAQNYDHTVVSETGDTKNPYQETLLQLNLLNHIRYNTDVAKTNKERIASVPGSSIVLDYLNRTTPKGTQNFEIKPDIFEGEELVAEDNKVNYVTPDDMWVSSNMMAAMLQKLENKTNDTRRYNAKGQPTYSVSLKTALNDEFSEYVPDINDTVKIIGFVESIGENRSLGFTSIGKTKIDTADYIDTSINMFMQEMIKSQNKPVIYVPTNTIADTGKIIYTQVESTLISTDKGFNIDYNVAANEMLREYDKNKAKMDKSRLTLNQTLHTINGIMGTEFVLQAEGNTTDTFYAKELAQNMKAISLEAHATEGKYEQLKKLFDGTDLVKDMKGKGNFDLSYKIDKATGLEYIVPGSTVTNDNSHYKYDYDKQFPGTYTTYIERIRTLSKEVSDGKIESIAKLESAIRRVYEKDYQGFTEYVNAHGFVPVESMNNLTRNTIGGDLKNPTNLTRGENPYFQRINKTETTKAEIRFNQPMFGFYLATQFANNHIDDFSLNPFSFKDVFDKAKRNGPVNTPAQTLLTDAMETVVQDGNEYKVYTGTLPKNSPGMFYRDNEVLGGKTFQMVEVDGKMVKQFTDAGNEIEPENGQTYINPLHYQMTLNSIGGTDTVLGNASMFKGLLNFTRADGSYSQFKRGDKTIDAFDMQNTYTKNMFMRMLAETDFRLIDQIGLDRFANEGLSFTNKFIQLYDDKANPRDFNGIIKSMMDWVRNQQYYEDHITVNPDGIPLAGAMYNSIVAFTAPTSTQKGAVTKVNDYHADNDVLSSNIPNEYINGNRMNMDYIDNSKTKIVMNPSQDTDVNNKLQAAPSQQDATGLGVTNNAEVSSLYSDYMKAKQDLQTSLRNELEDAISKTGKVSTEKQFKNIDWTKYDASTLTKEQMAEIDPAIEQLMKFMRTRVVNSLRTSGQDMAFIDLFNEENVSLQLPMMRAKVLQAYRNIANQAIQGRIKGMRLTQTAGEYVDEYVKDGKVYTRDNVLDNLGDGRTAKDYSFDEYYHPETDTTIAQNGFTRQRLQDMDIVGGQTTVGHVAMPNVYAKIYGHRSNESMIDIQQIRIGDQRIFINGDNSSLVDKVLNTISDANTVEEWKTIVDSPMVRKAIQNLKVEQYADEILNMERNEDGEIMMSKRMTNLLKDGTDRTFEDDQTDMTQTNDDLLATIEAMQVDPTDIKDMDKIVALMMSSGDMLEMVLDEAQYLLQDFEKSNTAFLSRVPATFLGSGGVFKSVMFHNGGNVVYVPTGMINRNDADFDIDALTNYSNSVDRNGHIIEKGADGYRNRMNDIRNTITLHSSNQESLFLTSSLKKINEVTESKKKKQDQYYNNSARTIFETYSRNKAGADAIGILANTLTVSSSVISGYSKGYIETGNSSGVAQFLKANTTANGLPITGLEGFVIELGTWQQGALDNAKNNTFANYAISPLGINILGVLKLNGMNNSEIYDFFNNYNIRNLFHAYSGKTSIMTKSSDFNLYKFAKEASKQIESTQERFINETKSNVNEYLASKGMTWKSNIKEPIKYQQEIGVVDTMLQQDIDSKLLTHLQSLENSKVWSDSVYNFNGTPEEQIESLNKWKNKNGLNDFTIFDNKNNKTVFDNSDSDMFGIKDLKDLDKKSINELKLMIRSRANLNIAKTNMEGLRYMNMIPNLSVTADALYRLSTIMGMRKGLPVLDKDFNGVIANIEQYLGMSLKDYTTYNNTPIDIDKHIAYFMATNDTYNKMADSTETKPTDKQFLVDQEKLIAGEINIAKMIKNIPQLDFILRDLYRQKLLTQNMFMMDNVLLDKELTKGFLKTQNRTQLIFGGEISTMSNAITDVILDKYYNSIGEDSQMKGMYVTKTVMGTYQNNSRNLDMNSLFDRQSFVKNFPEYMLSIAENVNNIEFLRVTMQNPPIDSDLMKLQNNALLKLLSIGGKFEGKLRLDMNVKEMTEQRTAQLRDEFKKLPKEYQNMLINYEIISNRMSYSPNGIMQVIGTDFFKDRISDVYNKTYNELRSELGMNALIPDGLRNQGVTYDNLLKERMYDNLGLKAEFSQLWRDGEVPTSKSPKYVYRAEKIQDELGQWKKTGHTVHFKMNDNTEYEEYNNITSLGMSALPGIELTTELKSFSTSIEEEHLLDLQLKQEKGQDDKGLIEHMGTRAWVKPQQFLFTRSGVLVRVVKVKGTNFSYRIANDTDTAFREKQRREDILKRNNRIVLVENTLQHDIFHPDATKVDGKPLVYKVKGDQFMTNLRIHTLTNDGKSITIPIFDGKATYNSINDVIDTFKERLIESVGEKSRTLKTKLNQFEGNTENEKKIARRKHYNRYLYNLIDTSHMVDENSEPTTEAKQAQVVLAYLQGRETLLLKHLVDQRVNGFVGKSKEKLKSIVSTEFLRNQDTTFSKEVESVRVGKSTYGKVVRTSIIEKVDPKAMVEMKAKEQERSDMLDTLEGSLSLWNTDVNKTKVEPITESVVIEGQEISTEKISEPVTDNNEAKNNCK